MRMPPLRRAADDASMLRRAFSRDDYMMIRAMLAAADATIFCGAPLDAVSLPLRHADMS